MSNEKDDLPTASQLRQMATSETNAAVRLAVQRVLAFAKQAASAGNCSVCIDLDSRADVAVNIRREVRPAVEQALKARGFNVNWQSGDQRDPCDNLVVSW